MPINTHCLRCSNPLLTGNKFCSRKCKSESQKKRIFVVCSGCKKQFSILPYLKRSTNYCSRDCYLNSTKEGEERFCRLCHNKFYAKGFLVKKGFGFFCSRECQLKAYPSKIRKYCLQCEKTIAVWPAKVKLVKFCSKKCRDDSMRDYISSLCRKCGKKFDLPRSDLNRGRGNFCSRQCYINYRGETSIEKKVRLCLEKARISYKQEAKIGYYRVDFLLPDLNVVVECDGVYWHKNSQLRDRRKNSFLSHKGYRVVRISEEEINKSSGEILEKLLFSFKDFSQVESGAYFLVSVK